MHERACVLRYTCIACLVYYITHNITLHVVTTEVSKTSIFKRYKHKTFQLLHEAEGKR